jgi:hypothetical protein
MSSLLAPFVLILIFKILTCHSLMVFIFNSYKFFFFNFPPTLLSRVYCVGSQPFSIKIRSKMHLKLLTKGRKKDWKWHFFPLHLASLVKEGRGESCSSQTDIFCNKLWEKILVWDPTHDLINKWTSEDKTRLLPMDACGYLCAKKHGLHIKFLGYFLYVGGKKLLEEKL